jgi:hypothetical protein
MLSGHCIAVVSTKAEEDILSLRSLLSVWPSLVEFCSLLVPLNENADHHRLFF